MADITFFQTTNEEGETVLKPRPQCESIETLKQMIADGRPQKAIGLFVGYVANGMNWKYYDDWKAKQDAYEKDYAEVTDYNANPDLDENDQPILKDYPTEPEPLNFVEATVETVNGLITTELEQLDKVKGTTINGVNISLTEENQNGIAAVLKGLELADKHSQNVYPFNFKALTPTGAQSIPFNSLSEFELFALQFMAARQAYFT